MIVEVQVPEVGESITEGVLVAWAREDGDVVAVDDPLFELETDKITLTVQARAAGRLAVRVPAGEKVRVGQVVGTIDTAASVAAGAAAPTAPAAAPAGAAATAGAAAPAGAAATTSVGAGAAAPGARAVVPAPRPDVDPAAHGPAVRRLAAEHGLDLGRVSSSGKGGRVTKEDVLRHLEAATSEATERPAAGGHGVAPAPGPVAVTTPGPVAVTTPGPPGQRQTRRPLSSLRRRIAERMVQAQHTAAILTTFNEVDMSAVMALRERNKDAFQERHGVRLGFMSFFVKAAVEALRTVPAVNSFFEGESVVENHFYDIGVAVATEAGLVVPVLRDADRLSIAEVERQIADYARRARERKLELSDLSGGTFTISNGGVFGSLLSTPILNPPQSAILGLHAIKKRAVVVDDQIVARPMMYLALSYDHRLVDGKEAVTFLKHVVECIEKPECILLEL